MPNQTKRVRGKGVKPTMVYVSLRVDKEVYEFFNAYPNRSEKIREVLASFINQEKAKDENIKQEVTAVK
jgi:metal-responsive CopG/Arc/MetJ family transcriptional regulator